MIGLAISSTLTQSICQLEGAFEVINQSGALGTVGVKIVRTPRHVAECSHQVEAAAEELAGSDVGRPTVSFYKSQRTSTAQQQCRDLT
ncbi:hypothetical protein X769_22560 [Mesorhizobium sp. LSJC268A00]|uniref:hypothetical protein n=1 Tax=unclassified Mesorhizobium TaxID=325217 RepID=UPI0003CDFEEC|nr:hypothetical protein [Mesorhizobium sp. LSJC268A00]ESX00681.1 hypothetical protein X769_22560 [Mesorhizobium sp. LSJC268A00]